MYHSRCSTLSILFTSMYGQKHPVNCIQYWALRGSSFHDESFQTIFSGNLFYSTLMRFVKIESKLSHVAFFYQNLAMLHKI